MVICADASFLFSLYGNDAHSAEARRVAGALKAPFTIGPLHRLELRNAFRLAVFGREITIAQCRAVLANVELDLTAGVLAEVAPDWTAILERAEALSSVHADSLGTRAMGTIHVAMAITVGARDLYTFDVRQASLAKKAGLKVKP
jgi:predicted nucleic acid-binding protein